MLIVLGLCVYFCDEKPNEAFIIAIVMLSVTVFVGVFVATDLFHANPKTERYAIQSVSFEHNRVSIKVADRHGREHTELFMANCHEYKIVPAEVEKKPYLLKKTYHVGPIYSRVLEYHVTTIDLNKTSQYLLANW
jgi:hypothetical protein